MEKQKIEEKIDREAQKVRELKKMLRGTINKVVIKKGRVDGKDKVVYQLTYKSEKNITKTLYVKKEKLNEAKKMIRNYQKAKVALSKLLELNVELFKLE